MKSPQPSRLVLRFWNGDWFFLGYLPGSGKPCMVRLATRAIADEWQIVRALRAQDARDTIAQSLQNQDPTT